MLSRAVKKTVNGQNAYRQFMCISLSLRNVQNPTRFKSTAPATSDEDSSEVAQPVDSRPLKNEPFAKNLFLGKFDKGMLAYPELSKTKVEDLNQMVEPVARYFNEQLDSKSIDVNAKIPQKTLDDIKALGLFGQQIPTEYGGLGLNATEFARLAEVTALDGSIAVTLAAHQSIGLKGILIAGNEAQKQKYLPKLATGEHIAAFCLTEPSSGSDAASIQTRAVLSEDGKSFHLTGGKIWISNGGIADIFTVFAKTEIEIEGKKKDKVTAFIVERDFGGITSGKPEDKLGIRGSNTCEVHFDSTPVPIENVLGEVGGGFKVAMNILNSGRFSMGSSGAGILKKLIGMTAEHSLNRKQFGQHLTDFGLIQEKFAKMALTTYAMESMAYLTAGIIDEYQEPDCSVEAAMVKIFSSEGCWMCVNECLQILGGLGYMKDYPYERYLRDGRILMIFEGTNEILRLYVALTGMQYAGNALRDVLRNLKNPLMNPTLPFTLAYERIREKSSSHLLSLREVVHPSLEKSANYLDDGVTLFRKTVEELLKKHGKNIVQEQMILARVADMVIDLYAMTACIGRSSRAYCLGLENADHEVTMTNTFCTEAFRRVSQNREWILIGPVDNNQENYQRIAKHIFRHKGWAASHPLDRMF